MSETVSLDILARAGRVISPDSGISGLLAGGRVQADARLFSQAITA